MAIDRTKLWKIANQPLAVWALSTLVVGFFGTGYAQLTSRLRVEAEREQAEERLNAQLAVRVEFAGELAKTKSTSRVLLDTLLMDTPETRLDSDFKERPSLAILIELERTCGDCGVAPDRNAEARKLFAEAMMFRARILQGEQIAEDELRPQVQAIINRLLHL